MGTTDKTSRQLTLANDRAELMPSGKFGVNAETLVAEDYLSNALLDSHSSLLQRIIPTAADRQIAKFRADLVRIHSESRLDFFRQYKEFQRQSLKDAFDSLLMKGKITLRGENTEFFASHYSDLAEKVTRMSEAFLDEFGESLFAAENARHPLIKHKKVAMLEKRIEQFTSTVELLMERFAQIPTEGV